MMRKFIDASASVIFVVSVIILTLTFSIGLPIYIRPVYYAHIPSVQEEFEYYLDITLETEFIKEAYDDVLDYLTLEGREFAVGKLPYSEQGKGHFEDCKVLFDLNRNAFLVSFAAIVVLLILRKTGAITLKKPGKMPLVFYSGIGTLLMCAGLGFAVAINFEKAFLIFHKIFFPGKMNWMFDPVTDPIILFLPHRFFMNCAFLICISIFVISTTLIIVGFKKRKR